MKRFYLLFLIVVLCGCATVGTKITRNNNYISMPHYSFTVTPDEGWYIQSSGGEYEKVVITKKVDPILFWIQFSINTIFDNQLRASPAKMVADNYRDLELQNMIKLGVNQGLYQLKNVSMGEEIIGNKNCYTMHYVTFSKSFTQMASLYLYFPKEKNNELFIMAHYLETIPTNASLPKTYRHDFINALKSLQIR